MPIEPPILPVVGVPEADRFDAGQGVAGQPAAGVMSAGQGHVPKLPGLDRAHHRPAGVGLVGLAAVPGRWESARAGTVQCAIYFNEDRERRAVPKSVILIP